MSTPAYATGTPPEVGSAITRAWLLYFVVHTAIMIVINLALGSVYAIVLNALAGNPMMMRMGYMVLGLIINAPISFVLFQWAVRANVVPSMIAWAQQPDTGAQ